VRYYDLKGIVKPNSDANDILEECEAKEGDTNYKQIVKKFWRQIFESVNWTEHEYHERLRQKITGIDLKDEIAEAKTAWKGVTNFVRKYNTASRKTMIRNAVAWHREIDSTGARIERDRLVDHCVVCEKLHDYVSDKVDATSTTIDQTTRLMLDWAKIEQKKERSRVKDNKGNDGKHSHPSETAMSVQNPPEKQHLDPSNLLAIVAALQEAQKKTTLPDPTATTAKNLKQRKTRPCVAFHLDGKCGHGKRCHFSHEDTKENKEQAKKLAEEMAKKPCPREQKTGEKCTFKACRFMHMK